MIDTDFRVLDRQQGRRLAAQALARAIRIGIHQELHHAGDILFRARQPVLQREEVITYVLGSARNEAQQLGQAAQHFHLLSAGGLHRPF